MNIAEFEQRLADAESPLVVDVWAPWCGPCRTMKPAVEKLASEYEGRVEVVQLNADESPGLVQRLKVFSLPTILVFNGGEERARRMGAQNEAGLRSLFEAAGENREIPKIRGRDRFLRIAGAALLYGLAGEFEPAWLFQTGAVLLFVSAIHDRCPLIQGLKGVFSRQQS